MEKVLSLKFLFCSSFFQGFLIFRKISSGFRTDSVAFLRFDFQRQSGFFLLGIYFPLTLIVMCSWVSFWIVKTDVPSRVSLGTVQLQYNYSTTTVQLQYNYNIVLHEIIKYKSNILIKTSN